MEDGTINLPATKVMLYVREQYLRRRRMYAEAGGDPDAMQGDLTCYLPYDDLRRAFKCSHCKSVHEEGDCQKPFRRRK